MAPQYAQTADSRFPAIPNGKFKAILWAAQSWFFAIRPPKGTSSDKNTHFDI